jgi:hypothetical protein
MDSSKGGLIQAVISGVAVEYILISALVEDAKLGKWWWFSFVLLQAQILSGFVGWCVIDAFNKYQRRRRAAKASPR